jgi:hypothetical protein
VAKRYSLERVKGDEIDTTKPLPSSTYALRIDVRRDANDLRCIARVFAIRPDGSDTIGTTRCGLRLWRSVMLPGLLAFARNVSLPVSVNDTTRGPSRDSQGNQL